MNSETRIDIEPRTLNDILLINRNQNRYYLNSNNKIFTIIVSIIVSIICILCVTLGIYSIIK